MRGGHALQQESPQPGEARVEAGAGPGCRLRRLPLLLLLLLLLAAAAAAAAAGLVGPRGGWRRRLLLPILVVVVLVVLVALRRQGRGRGDGRRGQRRGAHDWGERGRERDKDMNSRRRCRCRRLLLLLLLLLPLYHRRGRGHKHGHRRRPGLHDAVIELPAQEGFGQGVKVLHERHRHGPCVRLLRRAPVLGLGLVCGHACMRAYIQSNHNRHDTSLP